MASAGRMLPALIPAGPAQGTRLCRPRGHWSCHHREDESPNKNLPGLCEEAQPRLGSVPAGDGAAGREGEKLILQDFCTEKGTHQCQPGGGCVRVTGTKLVS